MLKSNSRHEFADNRLLALDSSLEPLYLLMETLERQSRERALDARGGKFLVLLESLRTIADLLERVLF